MISGELFQSLSQISFCTEKNCIINDQLASMPQNVHLIHTFPVEEIKNYSKIFIYSHDIHPFFTKFFDHLADDTVIITHNSDIGVDSSCFKYLESPKIKKWFCQNRYIIHPKLFSIPIGILTLTYLWFPYMARPVFTAIRQIPPNLFDASSDMGAKGFTTIYRIVLPLIVPAIIAGSVFTFSLSLGDYLVAKFTGGSTQMIGSIIASNINLNPPVAAAFSMVPIAFVVIYLMVARRTGSLERM